MSADTDLDHVARLCERAQRILFVTGAGISADSGLPTYRGIGGLYDDTHTDEGVPIEVALSGTMMAERPDITWKYLAQIEANCRGAGPNRSHHAIARLGREKERVLVFTQNVDGLHQRAGSDDVIELHGSITRIVCSSDRRVAETWSEAGETPPRCPDCDSYLRPDVVWFGEALPTQALHRAFQAAETCDLFLSVGTSALVHPAASLPFTALERRTPTIEINPDETPLTPHATFVLPGPSGQILPALVAGLKN